MERNGNHFLQRIQIVVALGLFAASTPVIAGNAGETWGNDFAEQGTNPEGGKYPTMPEDEITPGSLCANPTEYRYPEKIKYCARNVDSSEKKDIIREYDQKYGFKIGQMAREDFKIDHLVPLCAGGSNQRVNLWPQHKSVFVKTDKIEEVTCRLMSMGKMSQDAAVKMIVEVKHHLDTADKVLADLQKRVNN